MNKIIASYKLYSMIQFISLVFKICIYNKIFIVTEEIRMYFGESIALYFTFLGFYTSALLIPMFLGFLQLLLVSVETIPFFCIFNVVWVTVFLEVRF